MRQGRAFIVYLLLLAIQVLIWNFVNLSQYVFITFLPAMILCLPLRFGSVRTMIVAFVLGFAADFFSQGVLGLSALALVPVALARAPFVRLVFGSEVYSRREDISVQRQGLLKVLLGILLSTGLFLLVYIWADGAGTRPLWFNALRFFLSLAVSSAVSLFVVAQISFGEDSRWR